MIRTAILFIIQNVVLCFSAMAKVNFKSKYAFIIVYDRNHLFGLGSDTETETENWPKLQADTETTETIKS